MTKQIFTALTVVGIAFAVNPGPAQAASAPENQLHQLQKQINEATKTTQQ